ncbi:MAG: hypothetical protein JWP01_4297 [Myxococcales bacterium]|nr:hypothetical protein [Myxococcales bacterium]
MWRVAIVLLLCTACKKQEAAAPPVDEDTAPPLPPVELKRGVDACSAYVTKVCACTAPAAKDLCGLARALPDALEVARQVSVSPDSKRRDVLQANDSQRKTIKECIEQTAKLPALGCE